MFELKSEEENGVRKYPLPITDGVCMIPLNCAKIGKSCFKGCTSLTSLVLPPKLICFGESALSNTNINEITIPERVTSIQSNCFNGCVSLRRVELPSSLLNIGESAFSNTGILLISIPEGVTKGLLSFDDGVCFIEMKDK